MFKRLTFAVQFASGHKLQGDHAFGTGLTAITGANEAGKSTRLEMLRYALFGAKALRTALEGYKQADARVEFVVGGVDYLVERRLTNAKLFRGLEQVAVSTRAVNAKIVELLGYGLEVFDVTNNCAQGRVEQLSSARPAERKALIERSVGMDSIDAVIGTVGKIVSEAEGEIAGMEKAIALSMPGPRPETNVTQTAAELGQQLEELKALVWEAASLRGRLSAPTPSIRPRPERPEAPDVRASMAELEAIIAVAAQTKATIAALEREDAALAREEAALARPTMTEGEITALEALYAERVKEYDAGLRLYEASREKKRLAARGTVECPRCEHEFHLEHADLAALAGVPDAVEKPVAPRDERVTFALERERMGNDARREEIQARREEINEHISHQKRLPDATERAAADLQTLRQYARDMDRYEADVQAHESDLAHAKADAAERNVARDRLAALGDVEMKHDDLAKDFAARQAYERDNLAWLERQAQYEKIQADLLILKEAAKGWRAGVEALKALKARIKAHLVPSLSAVASSYIARMTDGARTDVRVDNDFNIRVDGTPIEGLSGSAKAVANLSLRIALGLVLASRKFSVFLGDEIDASMDENRAESTAEALRNLKSQLSQIILVSHKPTEADHTITL